MTRPTPHSVMSFPDGRPSDLFGPPTTSHGRDTTSPVQRDTDSNPPSDSSSHESDGSSDESFTRTVAKKRKIQGGSKRIGSRDVSVAVPWVQYEIVRGWSVVLRISSSSLNSVTVPHSTVGMTVSDLTVSRTTWSVVTTTAALQMTVSCCHLVRPVPHRPGRPCLTSRRR